MCDGENYYVNSNRQYPKNIKRPPLVDSYLIFGNPEHLSTM